jgi:hypothetical protein
MFSLMPTLVSVYNVMLDDDRGGASSNTLVLAMSAAIAGSMALGTAIWLIRRGRGRVTPAAQQFITGAVVLIVFSAAAVAYVVYRDNVIQKMKASYLAKTYDVDSGCVTNFVETVDVHGVATDTFSVDGRAFEVVGGPWPIGFRRTLHDGSPVRPGASVRMESRKDKILAISLESPKCAVK